MPAGWVAPCSRGVLWTLTVPLPTDVSAGPRCSTAGRTKSQVHEPRSRMLAASSSITTHTVCPVHTASFPRSQQHSSPHACSPRDVRLCRSTWICPGSFIQQGSVTARLPCHLLNKDVAEGGCGTAEQFPWSPWFHFSSETNPLTSSLNTPLSFPVRHSAKCAALVCAAACRKNSTQCGWCKQEASGINKIEPGALTEGLSIKTAENRNKHPNLLFVLKIPSLALCGDSAILFSPWMGRRKIIFLLFMIVVIPCWFEVKTITRFSADRDMESLFRLCQLLEPQLAFSHSCSSCVTFHCLAEQCCCPELYEGSSHCSPSHSSSQPASISFCTEIFTLRFYQSSLFWRGRF